MRDRRRDAFQRRVPPRRSDVRTRRPDRYDEPIFGGLDTAVADQPVGEYDTRILSIDVSGDAAAVKVAESRFWGQDFTDFFLLSRIDGEWQIVAKSFDHIGPTA